MTTVEVLRAARERISDPDKWCGNGWGSDGSECALHAVESIAGFCRWDGSPAYGALVRAMDTSIGYVGRWNDTHTHAEVLAAFDRAIANEEAREAEFTTTGVEAPQEVHA